MSGENLVFNEQRVRLDDGVTGHGEGGDVSRAMAIKAFVLKNGSDVRRIAAYVSERQRNVASFQAGLDGGYGLAGQKPDKRVGQIVLCARGGIWADEIINAAAVEHAPGVFV